MKKRIISLILSLALVLCLLPATVQAASALTVSGTVNLEWTEGTTTKVQLLQDGSEIQSYESTEQTFSYAFSGVAAGTYTLQIDAVFCEDYSETITVSNTNVVVDADLSRKTDAVSFGVFCEDGQTDDPTDPLTVQLLKDGTVCYSAVGYCGNGIDEITVEFPAVLLGKYDVAITKEGYVDCNMTDYWIAGGFAGTTVLSRPFGRVSGSVIAKGINSEPILLELLQDGVVQATTTTTVDQEEYTFADRLPFGDYTLQVTAAGHKTYSQTVTINKTSVSVGQINMTPIYGNLMVAVNGSAHEVCVEIVRNGHLYKYADTKGMIATIQSLPATDYTIRLQDLETNKYVYSDQITIEFGSNTLQVDLTCKHENTTTTTIDATCTTAGSTTVTCDACGETLSTTELPAQGHHYPAVSAAGATAACTTCGQEVFAWLGMSVSLESSLEASFVVPTANLPESGYYAVLEKEVYHSETGEIANETTRFEAADFANYNDAGTMKKIVFSGVAAKQMTDRFTVTIYNADGEQISASYTRTIEEYILSLFGNAKTSEAMKVVAVDFLNYGAAAQDKFGYRTTELANRGLTAAQKKLATADSAVSGITDQRTKDALLAGTSVAAEYEIIPAFVYSNSKIAGVVKAEVSYVNFKGKTVSYEVTKEDFGVYNAAMSKLEIKGTAVADGASPITVKLIDASGNVVDESIECVNFYCARMAADHAVFTQLLKVIFSAKKAFA